MAHIPCAISAVCAVWYFTEAAYAAPGLVA